MTRTCPVTDGPCKAVACIDFPCGTRDRTMTLDQMIDALLGIRARIGGGRAVRLIVGGTAHPAPEAWFERGQDNGAGAICIGDDPR